MGLSPKVFGPTVWRMLHLLSMTYPDKPTDAESVQMSMFVSTLTKVLPCPVCSHHAEKYIQENPPSLTSRGAFIGWVNDFHNVVNARLGAKVWTVDESMRETARYYTPVKPDQNEFAVKLLACIGLVMIMGALFFLILRKKKP